MYERIQYRIYDNANDRNTALRMLKKRYGQKLIVKNTWNDEEGFCLQVSGTNWGF
jgi:hypothetical protein